ncbi:MAG: hypothetical protein GXP58_02190 [Deltaproteobacteria bacterium]|nr:hypothetical protein [Deltaproteobacteria bacterium]
MNSETIHKKPVPSAENFIRFQTTGMVGRSVATLVIPEGMEGNLEYESRVGSDSFLLAYADGRCDQSGETPWIAMGPNLPVTRLHPGIWKFWIFNESHGWFENVLARFIPSDRSVGTILIKTTPKEGSRIQSRIFYQIHLISRTK